MSPGAVVRGVGAAALGVVREAGAVGLLGLRTARAFVDRRMEWHEAARQGVEFGAGSVPVVAATSALVGAILVVQAGLYVRRFSVQELVGWFVGYGVLREVGPLLAGLVFSGRVGSRNAAELAAMSTRGQLDGLRAIGVDVVPSVVAPRAAAMFGSLAALYFLGVVVSLATALAAAWGLLDVPPHQFWRAFEERMRPEDLLAGTLKSMAYATAVALLSCRAGVAARGGASAVGEAAKASVVRSAFALVLLDLVVASLV